MGSIRLIDKRSMLLNTQMRFSPSLQPARENALDKIVENILFVEDAPPGLSSKSIQHYFSVASGGYSISSFDIEKSVKRLVRNDRVLQLGIHPNYKYHLSPEIKQEINNVREKAEETITSILRKLITNADVETSKYIDPFLKSLSAIFSHLGEESVRLIKGDALIDLISSSKFLPTVFEAVSREFREIKRSILENAITNFF